MVVGFFGLSGCFGGLVLRIPIVPPIVDCSHPAYQLDNSVRSLMSWSNNYQDQIDQGRNIADACAKTLSYRGSANCIDPSDPYVRRALRDTIEICESHDFAPDGPIREERDAGPASGSTGEEGAAGEEDVADEEGAAGEEDVADEETDGADGARTYKSDPALGPGHAPPPKTDEGTVSPEEGDATDEEEGGSAPE